jgi:hypothetical protein
MADSVLADAIMAAEKCYNGISYVFLRPDAAPRSLIVCFGAMGKGGYSRVSWFLPNHHKRSDAYLFLRDPLESYYCGFETPLFGTYAEIIRKAIVDADVEPRHVLTVGNSMGGTAAIMFAGILGLGAAAATNPQVDLESAAKSPWGWASRMRRAAAPFRELHLLLPSLPFLPNIHLFVGSSEADQSACDALLRCVQETGNDIVLHVLEDDHISGSPTASEIERIVAAL